MLLSARKYKKDSQSMIGTAPHITRNPDPVDTDAGIVLWRVVMIIHLHTAIIHLSSMHIQLLVCRVT